MRSCLLLALLLLPAALVAQGHENVSTRVSRAELDSISARGRRLAAYDEMAWVGTDSLQATHPKRGGRYLARPVGDHWEFVYGRLNPGGTAFHVEYRARGRMPGGPVSGAVASESDTGYYRRAARAEDVADRAFPRPARPYNVAVLPADSASWFIYFYPASTEPKRWPLGADVRFRVDDAGTLVERRVMHRSILEQRTMPAGGPPEAGFHANIVADRPEDSDVMLVLRRQPRMREYVVTETFFFRIEEDGHITPFDRGR